MSTKEHKDNQPHLRDQHLENPALQNLKVERTEDHDSKFEEGKTATTIQSQLTYSSNDQAHKEKGQSVGRTQCLTMSKMIPPLRSQLSQVESAQKMMQEFNKMCDKNKDKRQQITKLKKEIQMKDLEATNNRKQIEQVRQAIIKDQLIIKKHVQIEKKNKQEIQDLKKELQDSQIGNQANCKRIEESEKQKKEQKNDIDEKIKEIERKQREIQSLKKEIQAKDRDSDEKSKEIQRKQSEVKDLKKEIQVKSKEIQEKTKMIQANKAELQALNKEIQDNNKDIQDKKIEILDLLTDVFAKKKDIEDSKKEILGKHIEIDGLKRVIEKLNPSEPKSLTPKLFRCAIFGLTIAGIGCWLLRKEPLQSALWGLVFTTSAIAIFK